MKKTMAERKKELFDATTKARKHFLAVERKLRQRYAKQNPNKEWYEIADMVDKDVEYVDANARLLSLCDACIIMGIECGE